MKILLTEDVKKLGKQGDMVEVSDGYAKNYILPQKLGVEATKAIQNEWQVRKGSEANRRAREKQEAQALAAELNGKIITIRTKAGEGGKLFGSITSKDIAEHLEKDYGITVDKRKIQLSDPIRAYGQYDLDVKLYTDIVGKVHVLVCS